jgi:hypothetical protein
MASDDPSEARQRSGLTDLLSVFQRLRDTAPRDAAATAGSGTGGSGNFRASWRAWRRSRPFWGGLLMVLGGLELMVIPLSGVLGHGAIKLVIYIGIGGVFGVLMGVLLIACGIVLWVNPVHRTFYGIAGVALGILSFPASNLGGFFLGMLLAIVGGSIAFAWTPLAEPPVTAKPDAESSGTGPAETEPAGSGPPESDPETTPMSAVSAESTGSATFGTHAKQAKPAEARLPRRMAIAAMPLLLTAGLLGSPGTSAAPAAPQPICILGIFCFPSPSPSPSPSPTPTPSPSVRVPGIPGVPGGPSPSPSPSPTPAPKNASGAPGLVAATASSVIKAGSAELTDFAYQGAATLATASGKVQVMKFTASELTLSGGVTATVSQGGATTTTTSSALDFSGSVVLYATQLSGCLGPLCVTLTPANVLTGLLKLLGPVTSNVSLTLTSVTTDQPLVMAGTLQANGLNISLS